MRAILRRIESRQQNAPRAGQSGAISKGVQFNRRRQSARRYKDTADAAKDVLSARKRHSNVGGCVGEVRLSAKISEQIQ